MVDTDYGDWIEDVWQADGSLESLSNEQRIEALLDDHSEDAVCYGPVSR